MSTVKQPLVSAGHKSGSRAEVARESPSVESAFVAVREHLLGLQKPDGHWCGELQGDTILESETIFLYAFLGREKDPIIQKLANFILRHERPDGAWSCYPGGPVDLTVSVKAYFALKIAGHSANAPYMKRACRLIRDLGGAAKSNSFTKFYLALLGQFSYASCAAVPPEMTLLPKWAYINIYAMSSWTRTIVVPLSIFFAYKPVRQLPEEMGITELFLTNPHAPAWPHPPSKRLLSWTNFFLVLDQGIKWLERWGPQWIRQHALERATRWMFDHFAESDGVGAIYPPIIYSVICLKCLGYADDSKEMIWALKQLEDLMIHEKDTVRVQPCFSPVWDTAISLNALAMAGMGTDDPELEKAADWLVEREVRRPGDWSLMNPELEPSGWFFEYNNAFYPDTDDTSMVLMGLARSGFAFEPDHPKLKNHAPRFHKRTPAAERGVRWMLAMQNQDGGWAAFDRDINREILTKVPFADHNAMLDPSCPDITARVLEALGLFGYGCDHPQVQKALVFLEKTQDPRGCWLGRWGVNYIYGTWQVLVGLESVGYDMQMPMVQKAADWLLKVQQVSGAWGESCESYDDPSTAGKGEPTASQTAWAILGLIAAGEGKSREVRRGIDWLLHHQDVDGGWQEEQFTGTGFPRVFYLKYHLYRIYFPLMALARYRECVGLHPRRTTTPALRGYHWAG